MRILWLYALEILLAHCLNEALDGDAASDGCQVRDFLVPAEVILVFGKYDIMVR